MLNSNKLFGEFNVIQHHTDDFFIKIYILIPGTTKSVFNWNKMITKELQLIP